MNYKPMVTIAITCFNAQDTIVRAIISACAQDWANIEIIIVDDKSSDDSVLKIKQAIVNADNARLVCHKENLGPAGARNTLLKEAKGEFIAFFDDDDESLPNRVTEQVNKILQYEKASDNDMIACYASGVRKYPNGYTKKLPAIGSQGKEPPNGVGLAHYLLFYERRKDWFYGSGTPTCSLMARVSTFIALDGFDATLRRVEDADLAIRLALKGGHFIGTEASCFIQYSTSATDKSPEKNLEFEQRLAEKNKEYLCSIRRYYYALHWPELRYWHFKQDYKNFFISFCGLLLRNPLAVLKHFFATAPYRFFHERKMKK